MNHSPAVEAILQDWFAKQGVSSACPICGSSDWRSRGLLALPLDRLPAEQPLLAATAVCVHCAHLSLFDLAYLRTGR